MQQQTMLLLCQFVLFVSSRDHGSGPRLSSNHGKHGTEQTNATLGNGIIVKLEMCFSNKHHIINTGAFHQLTVTGSWLRNVKCGGGGIPSVLTVDC